MATWTPERRNTALEFLEPGDVIGDEDQSPEDRAADRAERFSGYLGKRLDEATGHADRYDAQPLAHGFQSEAKAERAAARHDRIADRSCDAWSKAEYWQRRTAGVISHALYVCRPDVRMGRIKEIEADIRRIEASYHKAHTEHATKHAVLLALVEHAEGKREKLLPFPGWQYSVCYIREADGLAEDASFTPEQTRRCMISAAFSGECSGRWQELRKQAQSGQIEAAAVAREWLDANGWETPAPCDPAKSEWHKHLTLRLAYENQMLEAQGGRLASVEIEPGGYIGGKLIVKVNKSSVTERVVSVSLKGPAVQGWVYKVRNVPGTDYALYQFDTERMPMSAYTAPTEESLAELAALKAEKKAKAPAKTPCPPINPTDEDAERLQAIWNEKALAEREASYKRQGYSLPVNDCQPVAVLRITQAAYSADSKGTYARAGTRELFPSGELAETFRRGIEAQLERLGRPVCQIRRTSGGNYCADRVIVLTDKPQKPLPAAVWQVVEMEVSK